MITRGFCAALSWIQAWTWFFLVARTFNLHTEFTIVFTGVGGICVTLWNINDLPGVPHSNAITKGLSVGLASSTLLGVVLGRFTV